MFIDRPGAQLHALSFGSGPLTLLAVGGWVAGGEVWHPLFEHLPHWRCIGVDHRGAGSSTRQGAISVDDMADDLLAVADAMAVGHCVLAGESSGAATVLRAMQRAPGRFLGQVLVGAAWQRTQPSASDAFVARLRQDFQGSLQSFIDNCLPETDSVGLRRWALQVLSRSSVDDAIELLRSRERITPVEFAPGRVPPSLLIHGSNDRIVPAQSARLLAERLPGAELHVLNGLGHVPIVTAATSVATLIDGFGQHAALHRVVRPS
jgi:pimeloyl-ACP methyl ester carboxylesterase